MNIFKSIFPYNQTTIAEYKLMSIAEIDKALQQSEKIFPQWSNKTFNECATVLKNISKL